MSYKPIIIVAGQPNSIFLEIFFKSIKTKKFKSPLILICSKKLLLKNMKKFKFKKKIKILKSMFYDYKDLNNDFINIIDVKYNQKNNIRETNEYIKKSFKVGFDMINKNISNKFINGPISKARFLNKKYLGITEYIAKEFSIQRNAMLIFNKKLSVCPLTTHLPIKLVSKKISKKLIFEKVNLIESFYKNNLKKKPKIGVVGLNPHCESISKFDEDNKIIKPAIKYLKKMKYKISGPIPADTIFLKKNRAKFDVIIGMYHDQVLTPLKTIFEYDAINITLGLPFIRISPDHGPNENMIGLNKSNPLSLIKAISFLDKN